MTGVSFQESRLIAGVAFKKTFSYAGFEMQQKKYLKPKIAMLNIELELKAERDNAEIRLADVAVSVASIVWLENDSLTLLPSGISKNRRCRMVDSLQ